MRRYRLLEVLKCGSNKFLFIFFFGIEMLRRHTYTSDPLAKTWGAHMIMMHNQTILKHSDISPDQYSSRKDKFHIMVSFISRKEHTHVQLVLWEGFYNWWATLTLTFVFQVGEAFRNVDNFLLTAHNWQK